MFKFIQSSQDSEQIMLRIKSFAILAIPYILNFIQVKTAYQFAPEPIIEVVNALFVVLFGIIHAYAWVRSIRGNTQVTQ